MPDPREKLEGLGETWDSNDGMRAALFSNPISDIILGRYRTRCQVVLGGINILVGSDIEVRGLCEPVEFPRAASVNIEKPLEWEHWEPIRCECKVPEERRATESDIENSAKRLGVDAGIIWAIGQVETGNCGFYAGASSFLPVRRHSKESSSAELEKIFGDDNFTSKAHMLRDWGFGRWMVLGVNFSHRTVYLSKKDREKLEATCPERLEILKRDKQGNPVFKKPEGFYRIEGFWGRRNEISSHGGAYIYRSETGGDGKTYQQECGYEKDGRRRINLNDMTPNLYRDEIPHTLIDPGGPVQYSDLPSKSALYQFYVDMHTNERVQLIYFEFVVEERTDLHQAMQDLTHKLHSPSSQSERDKAWQTVAFLYNGSKYKVRGYDEKLKAAYKESPVKGRP
jgi:hypothetical protein